MQEQISAFMATVVNIIGGTGGASDEPEGTNSGGDKSVMPFVGGPTHAQAAVLFLEQLG